MKLFKKALVIMATIIALLLVAAIFVNKEYIVEKEVTINKPYKANQHKLFFE